jgi:hypothetical protein
MSRNITIKSRVPVNSLNELNRLVDALVTVDEVYRVMQRPQLLETDRRVDFRKKEYRDIDGARLGGFQINSPPVITIAVDIDWLASLIFVLVNYKTVKENAAEIQADSKELLNEIKGLTKNEVELIEIGVRMLAESINSASESAVKGLLNKIQTARARISREDIESIEVSDDDT